MSVFALAHRLSKAHHIADRRQDFAQAAWRFCEFYIAALEQGRWSEDLEGRCVRQHWDVAGARGGRSTLSISAKKSRRASATSSSASCPSAARGPNPVQQFFEGIEHHHGEN